MKFINLIIFTGFLASCLNLPTVKSNNKAFISDKVKKKSSDSFKVFLQEEWNAVSDGLKRENIGPLKVIIPKGWCFNKAQWDKKRFSLEMTPECNFPFTKYVVHFTYWKEKKEKSFIETIQQAKKRKNAIFASFHMGKFKGQSVRYERDDQDFSFSAGLGDNDALLIMLSAPKGNLAKMEQALKKMLR